MDVLRAAKCGDITEDDVAAYHFLDLEIRYLADSDKHLLSGASL